VLGKTMQGRQRFVLDSIALGGRMWHAAPSTEAVAA